LFFVVQFCALFGTAVIPVCYCIVYQLSGSCFASVLAACLIVFGRHLVYQSSFHFSCVSTRMYKKIQSRS